MPYKLDSVYNSKLLNATQWLDTNEYYEFPPLELAGEDGLLAIGGNLSPGMLLSAYMQGIFPWFNENTPPFWWSLDPRFVLFPSKLHVAKSLKKVLSKDIFNVKFNTRFEEIIINCSSFPRAGQDGTWITDSMIDAYTVLFDKGFVNCAAVEDKETGKLLGGIYGVRIGKCFCGESMFTYADNASKYGFVHFIRKLAKEGVVIIDCQVHTEHLERFGAEMIPRKEFLNIIKQNI